MAQKNVVVQSRLSEVAYKNLKNMCKKRDITISEHIRDLILADLRVFLKKTYIDPIKGRMQGPHD